MCMQKPSGLLRPAHKKNPILKLSSTRTCLSKYDQEGSYMWAPSAVKLWTLFIDRDSTLTIYIVSTFCNHVYKLYLRPN